MVSAISSALSGLAAAESRLSVSANNIANQSSTKALVNGNTVDQAYVPQRVDTVSLSSGGVQAIVSNATPDTSSKSSNNPAPQVPAVDTAKELINISVASYDFQANLKVIEAQKNTTQSLLNIIG